MEEKQWKVLIDENQNRTLESPPIFKSIRENENNNINPDIKVNPFKANIVTITQTHVFTSTIHPSTILPSSPSQTTSSKPSSSVSSSSSSSNSNNANEQWQLSFPILLTFAVIGILCLLSLFVYFTYYFLKKYNFFLYLKRKIHQDVDDGDDEKTLQNEKYSYSYPYLPSTSSHIMNDINLRDQYSWADINYSNPSLSMKDININNIGVFHNKRNDSISSYPSTFVPIDASSLTLVPRSLIWKDPSRRRGVDELDMWEKRQYQYRHHHYQQQQQCQQQHQQELNGKQRQLSNLPIENNIYNLKVEIENKNEEEEIDPSNNMDNDRPWQRYKLKSPISQSRQSSDISNTLAMKVSDQENNYSNRSSNTILQSRPTTTTQDNFRLV